MTWWAKPEAFPFWDIDSTESYNNADEIYNQLKDTWTLTAICGMLGNMYSESGMNPWCWQNNTVSSSGGYGLVQFTPARTYMDGSTKRIGYIDGVGTGMEGYGSSYVGYAPNMSVTETTVGANVRDGQAQISAVDDNAGGKYSSYKRHCDYTDITSVNSFSDYKQCNDLWVATVGWLYYYEAPRDKSYSVAQRRFSNAETFWNHFTEDPPIPPTPPPPTPTSHKMPLWMYLRKC